ncbi:hypothetical protein ACHAQJ_002666 [Trichoderma viride]
MATATSTATEHPTWKLKLRGVKADLQTSQVNDSVAGYLSGRPESFGIDLGSISSAEDGVEKLREHAGKLKAHLASFRANSAADDIFKPIGKTVINEHQKASDDLKAITQKLQDDRVDKKTAKDRMGEGREKAKNQSNASIDKAFDAAEAKIDSLPESQQDNAADAWMAFIDGFVSFWNSIWGQFSNMLSIIAQWPSNVWEKIKAAWNTVKGIFDYIWNWFGGLF